MIRFVLLLFLLAFKVVFSQAKGASNQYDKNQLLSVEQSELIYKTIKNLPNETIISMAIIKENDTKFIGIKRINDTLISIDAKKEIFEIGSLTKNVTALLLAELIVNKRVDLNQEISTVFDFKLKDNSKITFNQLASHTSGMFRLPSNIDLTNFDNPYKNYSSSLLKTYLTEQLSLNHAIGEKWDYSNLGFGVLGYALTHHTKTDLQKLYEDYIFKKLNISNTFLDKSKYKNTLVQGQDIKGVPCSYWDFDVMGAAGGLKSSTEDLVKFVKYHFDLENPAVKMVFKERIKMNENLSGTMSWLNIKNKKVFFSNGGTGGFSTSWSIQPENKKGIIILTNVSGLGNFSEPLQTLNLQLLNTL